MTLYDDGKMTSLQAGDMILVEYRDSTVVINFKRGGKFLNVGRPYENCKFILVGDPNGIQSTMNLVGMVCGLRLEEIHGGFLLHATKDPAFTD